MIVDEQGNALGPEAPGHLGGEDDDGRLVQALGPQLDDGHAAVGTREPVGDRSEAEVEDGAPNRGRC